MPEMQKKKKIGATVFVSEIKRVVNYTDFEKLSQIIEHLQHPGFNRGL